MRFTLSSTTLSSHLSTLSKVITNKNAIAILECFLFEVRDGQAHLLEVVGALHAASRFTSRLNGGEKQTDEDTDDRNDDEQFYEGKTAHGRFFHNSKPNLNMNEWKVAER